MGGAVGSDGDMVNPGSGGNYAGGLYIGLGVGIGLFQFDTLDALEEVHGGVVPFLIFDDHGEFGFCGFRIERRGGARSGGEAGRGLLRDGKRRC